MALGTQGQGADIIRLVVGSIAGGIVMFIAGFIFWATPLSALGYSSMDETRSAAVQTALAQNVPHTGRYIVPDPATAGGTVLYGRGPVAMVDYNSAGFSTSDPGALIGGLVQEIVVVLLIGLALMPVASRVADWPSRARVAIGVASAAAVMIQLSDPIFNHGDWRFAVYALIADITMLGAATLILVRWFLPRASGVEHLQEPRG